MTGESKIPKGVALFDLAIGDQYYTLGSLRDMVLRLYSFIIDVQS